MHIEKSTHEDIDEIFRLYGIATNYQKEKFKGNIWPVFDRKMILNELDEQRQFKLLIDGTIACIWAITYNDPQIWEEKDNDPSIYIHRIATHPDFRGRNFVSIIVDWARKFAQEAKKSFIRLDTCGHNEKLIAHYQRAGFEFLGMNTLANADQLPAHYQNAEVCFFEIKLSEY